MTDAPLSVVILGLAITSSWGNGHATIYRALVRALASRGHDVLFLERDVPWYAAHRDLPNPPYGHTALYTSLDELGDRFAGAVREADLVMVGSYAPQGVAVGEWVLGTARGLTAFYDIDTPVTLATLARGECEYVAPAQIPRYGLYLSFTGGPLLERLEREYGAQAARPLYCAVDPEAHHPVECAARWDLGYMGTYSADRQPTLERLLLEPARRWPSGRFVVAGSQYPEEIAWPPAVERIAHLAPEEHPAFYCAQRYTLNVTRADMRRAGYSPSVRLFEAAACGTPVISDRWPGLETFFRPWREILVVDGPGDVLALLRDLPEAERGALAERARQRVLAEHTAAARARQLETYVRDAYGNADRALEKGGR
ncbi:MAG: glycosyltransferase [Chloroflexi bacterium]|nr:glycosyltransferase [Chloroflexota bacterium]